ncbi:hypothetical protein U9M48_039171, partial [Paspalum notatum var. saurae]
YFSLQDLAPTNEDGSFARWWQVGNQRVGSETRKDFNSIVILGSWSLWKHRNSCVFYGASPSLDRVLLLAKEEALFWSLAGARGISSLTALQQGEGGGGCTGALFPPFFLLLSCVFEKKKKISSSCTSSVYIGRFEFDTDLVAIKVFHLDEHGSLNSFLMECEVLRNTRHRNLMKAVTLCSTVETLCSTVDLENNKFKAIVFDFMARAWICGCIQSYTETAPREV